MTKLICEEWVLQEADYKGIVSIDATTGFEFSDIKIETKQLRVFGTKEQLKILEKRYNIDDSYEYKVEKPGSYWYKIYKDPEATNQEVATKLREYKKLYELNNNETLILRTR